VKLTRINNLLLGLIILVNGYTIAAPFYPALLYKWQAHQGKKQQLAKIVQGGKVSKTTTTPTQSDHLVIPAMLLNQPIYEGPISHQYKTLDKGIWRWPSGSTPDKGGNTTLIGHRFTYTSPKGVFYYLNKLKPGDKLGLWWRNKEYIYKVSSVREVPSNDTSIEAKTIDTRLTLFTCTPLWLPKNRLVVVAKLEANP
jgi:LPXTG-site transpeptidase (sortase) family protein